MKIRIKKAASAREIDGLYLLRHLVFVEKGKSFAPRDDQRFYDRFDALPATVNLIAMDEDKVIGGIRLTQNSDVGLPSEPVFDYQPYLPHYDNRIVSCSMFCIDPAYQGNKRIMLGFLLMGYYWATVKGATHLLAPINPYLEKSMASIGFQSVAEGFQLSEKVSVLPMLLDMGDTNDFFLGYVKQQKLLDLIENFERELYDAGDVIVKQGEEGDKAYVVAGGELDVCVGDDQKIVGHLKQGDVFGEIALLTNETRTASVIAKTPVDVMVLDQQSFQQNIINNPQKSLELIQSLSQRLKGTLGQMQDHLSEG